MQDYYNKYFPIPEWDGPLNDRYNLLGFGSIFFLNNMGTMIIGLAMIPILAMVLLILKPLTKVSRVLLRVYNKIHSNLFWSHQIILLNESFLMICMCALINSKFLAFESKFEVINSVLTIMFIVICSALPIVILLYLLVKFK